MTGHTASEATSDFRTINLTVKLDFQDGDTTSPLISFPGKTHPFPVRDMGHWTLSGPAAYVPVAAAIFADEELYFDSTSSEALRSVMRDPSRWALSYVAKTVQVETGGQRTLVEGSNADWPVTFLRLDPTSNEGQLLTAYPSKGTEKTAAPGGLRKSRSALALETVHPNAEQDGKATTEE